MSTIRPVLRMTALCATSLFVSATAAAQGASVTYPTAPAPPSAPAMPTAPATPTGTDAFAVPLGSSPGGAAPGPAPMALVPKSPDDLSGSIGFGVGVVSNSQLIGTNGIVGIKAWLSDSVALAPLLSFRYEKQKDVDATWHLSPEVVLLFAPFKTASTRFELGGGLGFGLSKDAPVTTPPALPASTDTRFDIYVPIQAGVEHLFTRWFSMGIAARANLIDFQKQGDSNTISFAIDSTALLGQLFFYTD